MKAIVFPESSKRSRSALFLFLIFLTLQFLPTSSSLTAADSDSSGTEQSAGSTENSEIITDNESASSDHTDKKSGDMFTALYTALKAIFQVLCIIAFIVWVMLCFVSTIFIFIFDLITFFQLKLTGGYVAAVSDITANFLEFIKNIL